MTHRAPDDTADVPAAAPRSRLATAFQERFLPHWGMLAIVVLYVAFFATVGAAAVPQPISLGFTGTLATWFGYLIQQSKKTKDGGT